MVRVRAIAVGYYEGYREIGDEFDVPEHFPPSPWWRPLHPSEPGARPRTPETEETPRRRPGRPPAVRMVTSSTVVDESVIPENANPDDDSLNIY